MYPHAMLFYQQFENDCIKSILHKEHIKTVQANYSDVRMRGWKNNNLIIMGWGGGWGIHLLF